MEESLDKKLLAKAKLEGRRRRISRLRRRVVTGSATCFALLCATFAIKDYASTPPRSAATPTTVVRTVSPAPSPEVEGGEESAGPAVVAAPQQVQVAPVTTPAPVTTSQS